MNQWISMQVTPADDQKCMIFLKPITRYQDVSNLTSLYMPAIYNSRKKQFKHCVLEIDEIDVSHWSPLLPPPGSFDINELTAL